MDTESLIKNIRQLFETTCEFVYYVHKYMDETDFKF